MLAALGMAWDWSQPSVTLRSLRVLRHNPPHRNDCPPPPRHTLWCTGLIFRTQPIPALSQTRPESPPERGPGRQDVYRGCVHGVCVRGPGACARICVGVTAGSWGCSRCRARPLPGTAGPALSPPRYPRRPAEVLFLPACHHPRPSLSLPGVVVQQKARRMARRVPGTPAPSIPRGAGPAMPFE